MKDMFRNNWFPTTVAGTRLMKVIKPLSLIASLSAVVLAVFVVPVSTNSARPAAPAKAEIYSNVDDATVRCGGGGGTNTKVVDCGTGYITGIKGTYGSYVQTIEVRCSQNGDTNPQYFKPTVGVGSSNPQTYSAMADSRDSGHSMVLDKIITEKGIYLDRIYSISYHYLNDGFYKQKTTRSHGSLLGQQCIMACPKDQAMYRLEIKYGQWIDSITGYCKP